MELGKDRSAESAIVELVRKFIYKGDCGGKDHEWSLWEAVGAGVWKFSCKKGSQGISESGSAELEKTLRAYALLPVPGMPPVAPWQGQAVAAAEAPDHPLKEFPALVQQGDVLGITDSKSVSLTPSINSNNEPIIPPSI